MNPLDYSKAVSEFWTSQGRAFMKAQEQVAKALSEGIQAAAGGKFPTLTTAWPDTLSAEAEDLGRASKSLVELWSAATGAYKFMEFVTPLLRLLRRSQGGTRDSACGRHLRACRSRRRCARPGRVAPSLGSSASVASCSCAWRRSR
jgi:hypothetical protein